jgi:hypothetical protein
MILLAAATTVAIAWIGSLAFRPERATWTESPPAVSTRLVRRELLSVTLMIDRAGWPLAAMACEYELASSARDELFVRAVHGGVPVELPPPDTDPGGIPIRPAAVYARALPLRPLAAGFLIDTTIYLVVIRGVAFLTAALARRRAFAPECASAA